MMYIPSKFRVQDLDQILELARKNPFATLITTDDGGAPFASHLPIIVERSDIGSLKILGHLSRGNPQWRHFAAGRSALAVIHGPHTYITPNWYAENDVPTWNYAVAHLRGPISLIEEESALLSILRRSTEFFEAGAPDPWRFSIPDDLSGPGILTRAIVGFEMIVESADAKFKLSQNRSEIDRQGVIDGLRSRDDDGSRGVRELMLRR